MFYSITKYTIVENPHPPQGGVPLFLIEDLYACICVHMCAYMCMYIYIYMRVYVCSVV